MVIYVTIKGHGYFVLTKF